MTGITADAVQDANLVLGGSHARGKIAEAKKFWQLLKKATVRPDEQLWPEHEPRA